MVKTDQPHFSFALEFAAKSDIGKLRLFNEDSVFGSADCGLLVLADGMGGHKLGDVASSIVTAVIGAELNVSRLRGRSADRVTSLVRKVIEHAGRHIFTESKRRALTPGNHPNQAMGSTVALLLLSKQRAIIAHVGDSRVYRLRDRQLKLLTHDHSLLQEQVDHGAISVDVAVDSHNRHLVTRGLGLASTVDVAMQDDVPQLGDIYLLCSDGLNDMVGDDDIELVLNAVGANLQLAAEQLVMIANDAGGEDNVSVIVARVVSGSAASASTGGFWSRLFGR